MCQQPFVPSGYGGRVERGVVEREKQRDRKIDRDREKEKERERERNTERKRSWTTEKNCYSITKAIYFRSGY
jgi:hypothetical protein